MTLNNIKLRTYKKGNVLGFLKPNNLKSFFNKFFNNH